ncbi:MAG: hypothetical protein AAGE52_18340 [Myxococcota bacterium]
MSLAELVHDVGKYVSRTARNLPDGEIPPVLVAMLCRDLYALQEGRRASTVFRELAADYPAARARCQDAFDRIDALEAEVRAGEPGAVREAATLAMSIDSALRALEAS